MRGVLTERGSATVFMMSGLAVILFVGVAVAGASGLVVAHRRAQSAADLAAVAGAGALGTATDPCEVAGRLAAAADVTVESCRSTPVDITLVVWAAGPDLMGQHPRLRATARAGR